MMAASRVLFRLAAITLSIGERMFSDLSRIRGMIREKSLRTFIWVWVGSLVSFFGTAMTRFALMIWAYQQTNSAATLALLGTANYVPYLIFSPLAGVVVDRMDRRLILLLSDLLSGLTTVTLLILYLTGSMQIWHLYLVEALTGFFEAFQVPAYYASTSLLVPKEHITRTNGMRALAANSSRVLAPLIAGGLLAWLGITVIMAIDIVTFLFSVIVLSLLSFPRPKQSQEGKAGKGHFMSEMKSAFVYIQKRPGLVGLMWALFGMNVLASLTYYSILPALILARSGQSEWTLGIVQSVMGFGGVAGGLLLSIYGGSKRKIDDVLAGGVLSFMLGDLLFGAGQNLWVWVLGALGATVFIPFIAGSSQSIWQLKVEQDMQGRVFALKDSLQQAFMPFGYAIGGLAADYLFEPAMRAGQPLQGMFGWLVGSGPGAGIGLMFVLSGIAGVLICASGYLSPALRNVERDLPDVI